MEEEDLFDPRLAQAWAANPDPNPADLTAARRRWRSADEDAPAARISPEARAPMPAPGRCVVAWVL